MVALKLNIFVQIMKQIVETPVLRRLVARKVELSEAARLLVEEVKDLDQFDQIG
jgi:hypothetical protein